MIGRSVSKLESQSPKEGEMLKWQRKLVTEKMALNSAMWVPSVAIIVPH